MEETNSSNKKDFSLNQTILHIAAAIQVALGGQDLPCIILAQHEPKSIHTGIVIVIFVVNDY